MYRCVFSDDKAYAEGRLWSHLSENWERLHMVEHSGSDTAMSSQQTPPHLLKRFDTWWRSCKTFFVVLHSQKSSLWWTKTTPFIGLANREFSELTNWFGNSHDLRAVKRQITERPDDRMNLLHYVEGDGNNATCVLAHSHTPGGMIRKNKLNQIMHAEKRQVNKKVIFIANRLQWPLDQYMYWLNKTKARSCYNCWCGLTQARSGWAQTGWAT